MPPFKPEEVIRRQLYVYPVFAVVGVVGIWGYWALAAYTGNGQGSSQFPTNVRLIIAVIGSVLVPIGTSVGLLKTWALVSRGRMAQARLVKFGSATSEEQQLATFEYLVDGRTHTVTTSVQTRVLEQFLPNTKVPVIYDTAEPSRSQVFPSHNPQINLEGPSLGEGATRTLMHYIFGGLAIAQMVLVFLVLRLLNEHYDVSVFGPACLGVVAATVFELRLYDRWAGVITPAYKARAKFFDRVAIALALACIVWTPLAMRNASASATADQERQEQNDKDRAAGEKQSADMAKSMQILQDAIARRELSKTTMP